MSGRRFLREFFQFANKRILLLSLMSVMRACEAMVVRMTFMPCCKIGTCEMLAMTFVSSCDIATRMMRLMIEMPCFKIAVLACAMLVMTLMPCCRRRAELEKYIHEILQIACFSQCDEMWQFLTDERVCCTCMSFPTFA